MSEEVQVKKDEDTGDTIMKKPVRYSRAEPTMQELAAEEAVKVAHDAGMRKAKVYVKGPGNGRESAIRTIHNNGIEVTEIYDVTPMPHNGCRPPKRRRV